MTAIDWSVTIGALTIAGTVVAKWLIPAVLSLGKNGTTAAQAASRDVVDAINNSLSAGGAGVFDAPNHIWRKAV